MRSLQVFLWQRTNSLAYYHISPRNCKKKKISTFSPKTTKVIWHWKRVLLSVEHFFLNVGNISLKASSLIVMITAPRNSWNRKLDYNILTADLTSSSIQESLKRISRLELLSIRDPYWPGLNWNNNPIRPALLRLLHLPTLTHFKMIGINDFVVSDLIPCVNLEYLDIGSVSTTASVSAETGSLAWEFNPTARIRSKGPNPHYHHEVLLSSTSWWTTDHRFWVSVQDNSYHRLS